MKKQLRQILCALFAASLAAGCLSGCTIKITRGNRSKPSVAASSAQTPAGKEDKPGETTAPPATAKPSAAEPSAAAVTEQETKEPAAQTPETAAATTPEPTPTPTSPKLTIPFEQLGGAILGKEFSDNHTMRDGVETMMKELPQEELATLMKGINSFGEKSFKLLFSEKQGRQNMVYAPMGLYMDLAMLAEMAAGDTEKLLTGALDADTGLGTEKRGKLIKGLMDAFNVSEDEFGQKALLANSIWLHAPLILTDDAAARLAEFYRTDSFVWTEGHEKETHTMMGKWIEDKTSGMLPASIIPSSMPSSSDTMILINSIYYKANWPIPFDEGKNTDAPFTRADGSVKDLTYMHMEDYGIGPGKGIKRGNYQMGQRELKNGGLFRVILPNAGVSPADALAAETFWQDMFLPYSEAKSYDVTWSLPKSSLTQTTDLMKTLKGLGLEQFTTRMDLSRGFAEAGAAQSLSTCQQSLSFKLQEIGLEAAAVTMIGFGMGDPKDFEDMDMKVDRPFFFGVFDATNLPVLIGYIENPVTE